MGKKLRGMLGFVVGSLRGRREEAMFVMVGLVRGSSEAEMGLAAWVEGREAWHRLRKGKRGLGLGRTKKIKKKKKKKKGEEAEA